MEEYQAKYLEISEMMNNAGEFVPPLEESPLVDWKAVYLNPGQR